ncbi:MAG: efflux RND transporter periplasmic adaptor subunit, partial [Tannerellaceae bacterium]|nr:efflux RND transporter periplasmic adaptor subunit [Tannerellaceae bacterium]
MGYNKLLALFLLAGLCCACGGEKKETNETEESVETVLPTEANEVTVMTLSESDFYHELISNGKLSARKSADLRFESIEDIAAVYVKNGDRVEKGQKLAELTTFRLGNRLFQAKDALERAKLELQDVLIGQGYLLEDSAKVPPETMRLIRVKSGYDQALAAYELAAYEQEKAVLTAPFDGIVANLFSKEHNASSTSDIFCTVIDPSGLEASFTILESELPLIKTGDKVEVTPYAAPDTKVEGRISEINPVVDDKGTVQVKALVSERSGLFEGMNVRVSVQRMASKQLVVPKEAVVLRSGKQVIFTLVEDKAYWVYAQTGLENSGYYT